MVDQIDFNPIIVLLRSDAFLCDFVGYPDFNPIIVLLRSLGQDTAIYNVNQFQSYYSLITFPFFTKMG